MLNKITFKLAIVGSLLLLQLQSSAYGENLYEEGLRYYKAGELTKAGRCLEQELQTHPSDANAHYLMGNIFFGLRRTTESITEYQTALEIDPHGPVGKYCRTALEGILKAAQTQSPSNGTASSTYPSTASGVQTSAAAISKETDERESQYAAERDARIRDTNAEFERQIKTLENEMQEKIAANGPSIYVYSRLGRILRYNSEPDNQAIKNEYQPKIDLLKKLQEEKVESLRAECKQKQAAAEETAISMDRAYLNRNGSANVRLHAEGTNTHVRQYETADEPSGSPVPIAAPPAAKLPTTNK